MMQKEYGAKNITLHEFKGLITAAAKIRGMTRSEYARVVLGEAARVDLAFARSHSTNKVEDHAR